MRHFISDANLGLWGVRLADDAVRYRVLPFTCQPDALSMAVTSRGVLLVAGPRAILAADATTEPDVVDPPAVAAYLDRQAKTPPPLRGWTVVAGSVAADAAFAAEPDSSDIPCEDSAWAAARATPVAGPTVRFVALRGLVVAEREHAAYVLDQRYFSVAAGGRGGPPAEDGSDGSGTFLRRIALPAQWFASPPPQVPSSTSANASAKA